MIHTSIPAEENFLKMLKASKSYKIRQNDEIRSQKNQGKTKSEPHLSSALRASASPETPWTQEAPAHFRDQAPKATTEEEPWLVPGRTPLHFQGAEYWAWGLFGVQHSSPVLSGLFFVGSGNLGTPFSRTSIKPGSVLDSAKPAGRITVTPEAAGFLRASRFLQESTLIFAAGTLVHS